MLIFSAAIALVTGILFGISPAWQLSRPQIGQFMQATGAKHSGGSHGRRTHRVLIAGQVALTLLMMAGAGAALRSFVGLTHTPLGFDPDHVFAMNVAVPKGGNRKWQERMNAAEVVRQAVAEAPGVAAASVSTTWIPPFGGFTAKIEVQGKPSLTDAQAELVLVSPQIFSTLHIPLLTGRIFTDVETVRAAHLALVNQSFVKQFLAGENPIGKSVRSPTLKVEQADLLLGPAPDDWLQVIGMVGDARNDGLEHPVKPAIFLPYSFVLTPDESMLVRASGDPEATIRSAKQRLREVNAELVVSNDHTMAWWLETQGWGQGRFIATLFSVFAILALALAAAGLYSVVSYAVTQRTQEVGIRMALGARRGNVVRLVLSSTGATLAAGMVVGLGLSIALSRIVASWSSGNSRDPLTLLAAAAVLVMVAALACIFPAWRAATIDPMKALRME